MLFITMYYSVIICKFKIIVRLMKRLIKQIIVEGNNKNTIGKVYNFKYMQGFNFINQFPIEVLIIVHLFLNK